MQVANFYTCCVVNAFSTPLPLIGNSQLNFRVAKFFEPEFAGGLRILLDSIAIHTPLPDQKPAESRGETHLLQMNAAADSLLVLRLYLCRVKKDILERAKGDCGRRIEEFYSCLCEQMLPAARRNLAAVGARHFLPLKKLKLELIASSWSVSEVQFEYHDCVQTALTAFQRLDRTLAGLRMGQPAIIDMWSGSWMYVKVVLVSAFGHVRSCTAFGRSLMVGDTRAVAAGFMKCGNVEVDTSDVLEFVNAYFYKSGEFVVWMEQGLKKYKSKWIGNLVKTGLNCKLTAKEVRDLLGKLDTGNSILFI
jgi:hypothetical protein